jgi:hypothetical protein
LLIGIVAVALGLLLYRYLREHKRRAAPVSSQPLRLAPDLRDETVGPDQLPEDGWTRLARELFAKGDLRLALRAFYLASLAHLAERNLISLARFKSNRDYERELQRRGHAFPSLLELFERNLGVFEAIWYGMHEVSSQVVAEFASNLDRMRTGGASDQ